VGCVVAARWPERAARWFGAAAVELRVSGGHEVDWLLDSVGLYETAFARVEAALGRAAFSTAWIQGQALSTDQAMGEAVQVLGTCTEFGEIHA
jgi:hypothetical protein